MARRVLHPHLHVLPALCPGGRQQGGAERGCGHIRVPLPEHQPPHLPTGPGTTDAKCFHDDFMEAEQRLLIRKKLSH